MAKKKKDKKNKSKSSKAIPGHILSQQITHLFYENPGKPLSVKQIINMIGVRDMHSKQEVFRMQIHAT